jgi:hypothetical protein
VTGRPALVGPVTGRDPFTGRLYREQVVFCSLSCRQRYTHACPELIADGWTEMVVDDLCARNQFGHAYSQPACSTCSTPLIHPAIGDVGAA